MDLEQLMAHGNPLIEGERVTFVWRGPNPPQLIGDFTYWGAGHPISLTEQSPDMWTYTHEFATDAYIEYNFIRDGERVLDPHNPRQVEDGVGGFHAYFGMPNWTPTPFRIVSAEVQQGRVSEHTIHGSFVIGTEDRKVYLYQPPVTEPVPLLVVFDGSDYYKRASLPTLIDNLIAQKRIRPIALAMVDHGDQARFVEYMCNDATLGLLMRFVLPLAARELNLVDIQANPGAYGILGASMGGLMSLYAGLRIPEVFGHVLSQSGAFGFELNGRKTIIWELVRLLEKQPIQLWMDVGRYEYLIGPNREMLKVLQSKGYEPTYREYSGGHSYIPWRDDLPNGLEALFGLK